MGVYRRYRGNRRRVGFLIPTLIILCVLAAATLIYLNANLESTPEGMELKLPFSEKSITFGGKDEPIEDVPLIIEEPQPSGLEMPEEQMPISYENRIENSIFLPIDIAMNADALAAALKNVEGSAVNTVILEVKAEDGTLAFKTSDQTAIDYGINQDESTALAEAVKMVTDAGLNPVAQIACFRDDLMARKAQALACRSKNKVIWLDYEDHTWLNPYSDDARAYLTTVIDDVYQLGFREILLTRLSFPVDGKTSVIYYSQEAEQSKQEAMKIFFAEIKALADSHGDLNVAAFFDNYSSDEDAPGGQSLADLSQYFYRIHAEVKQDDSREMLDLATQHISQDKLAMRFVPRIRLDEIAEGTNLTEIIGAASDSGTGYALWRPDGVYDAELFLELTE